MTPEATAVYDSHDNFRWEEKKPERREWGEKGDLQNPSAISSESLDVGGDTYSSVFLNYVSNVHVH